MPTPFISDALWERYKELIGNAGESFNKDVVLFFKESHNVDRWQEDTETNAEYTVYKLSTLLDYNTYHSWPINKEDEEGQKDRQTVVFWFNREYLKGLGFLDGHGNFLINPSEDYFVHRGQEYRVEGDTLASQAQNDPLLFMVICRRQPVPTGEARTYIEEEIIDRVIPD